MIVVGLEQQEDCLKQHYLCQKTFGHKYYYLFFRISKSFNCNTLLFIPFLVYISFCFDWLCYWLLASFFHF